MQAALISRVGKSIFSSRPRKPRRDDRSPGYTQHSEVSFHTFRLAKSDALQFQHITYLPGKLVSFPTQVNRNVPCRSIRPGHLCSFYEGEMVCPMHHQACFHR